MRFTTSTKPLSVYRPGDPMEKADRSSSSSSRPLLQQEIQVNAEQREDKDLLDNIVEAERGGCSGTMSLQGETSQGLKSSNGATVPPVLGTGGGSSIFADVLIYESDDGRDEDIYDGLLQKSWESSAGQELKLVNNRATWDLEEDQELTIVNKMGMGMNLGIEKDTTEQEAQSHSFKRPRMFWKKRKDKDVATQKPTTGKQPVFSLVQEKESDNISTHDESVQTKNSALFESPTEEEIMYAISRNMSRSELSNSSFELTTEDIEEQERALEEETEPAILVIHGGTVETHFVHKNKLGKSHQGHGSRIKNVNLSSRPHVNVFMTNEQKKKKKLMSSSKMTDEASPSINKKSSKGDAALVKKLATNEVTPHTIKDSSPKAVGDKQNNRDKQKVKPTEEISPDAAKSLQLDTFGSSDVVPESSKLIPKSASESSNEEHTNKKANGFTPHKIKSVEPIAGNGRNQSGGKNTNAKNQNTSLEKHSTLIKRSFFSFKRKNNFQEEEIGLIETRKSEEIDLTKSVNVTEKSGREAIELTLPNPGSLNHSKSYGSASTTANTYAMENMVVGMDVISNCPTDFKDWLVADESIGSLNTKNINFGPSLTVQETFHNMIEKTTSDMCFLTEGWSDSLEKAAAQEKIEKAAAQKKLENSDLPEVATSTMCALAVPFTAGWSDSLEKAAPPEKLEHSDLPEKETSNLCSLSVPFTDCWSGSLEKAAAPEKLEHSPETATSKIFCCPPVPQMTLLFGEWADMMLFPAPEYCVHCQQPFDMVMDEKITDFVASHQCKVKGDFHLKCLGERNRKVKEKDNVLKYIVLIGRLKEKMHTLRLKSLQKSLQTVQQQTTIPRRNYPILDLVRQRSRAITTLLPSESQSSSRAHSLRRGRQPSVSEWPDKKPKIVTLGNKMTAKRSLSPKKQRRMGLSSQSRSSQRPLGIPTTKTVQSRSLRRSQSQSPTRSISLPKQHLCRSKSSKLMASQTMKRRTALSRKADTRKAAKHNNRNKS